MRTDWNAEYRLAAAEINLNAVRERKHTPEELERVTREYQDAYYKAMFLRSLDYLNEEEYNVEN
jgi:transcriptional regulator of acetoin/glycerol metabolism